MNYYELLDKWAKAGLNNFKHELETNPISNGLLWTIMDETDEMTTIDIETWDEETLDAEFLTRYEFDNNGNVID